MRDSINRRVFLGTGAAMAASGLVTRTAKAKAVSAQETVVVGVMGLSRGRSLARTLAGLPGVEVAYVCDVDERRTAEGVETVSEIAGKSPQGVTDFRRILDDGSVDALVNAASNHWHAPATILASDAGKHSYVEKPCSHNPREGELMVQKARKHKSVVQMGNQRRSWPAIIEAIERVRSGDIGRAYFARTYYSNRRGSIGHGKTAEVPPWLDYALWQGPAPRRPYRDNVVHYNWHWFWHWGNGELGNNGVHMIDLCRWGLDADYPIHVSSGGGRYHFQDDQETPDTHTVVFDFEDRKAIRWEGLSCNPHQPGGSGSEVVFHGDKGSLAISGGGYEIFDLAGKSVEKVGGPGSDEVHLTNFLDTIRGRATLTSEILEGHKSTLLCHLGNIAHRTGRALRCDPTNGHILDDSDAMTYWSREYEPGWEPKV